MEKTRRRWILPIITIVIFLLALLSESLYFSDLEYHYRTRRFNRILQEKEKILEECLKDLEPIIARGEPLGSPSEKNIFAIAEQNEITILEYLDNMLNTWSDNTFDVPLYYEDSTFTMPFVFLQNGWFVPKRIRSGNEVIVGLLRVRTDFGFENEIIRSGFEKYYRIPDEVTFSTTEDKSDYKIYNNKGDFLFSLTFPDRKSTSLFILVPVFLWSLVLMLIIILLNSIVKTFKAKGRTNSGLLLGFLISGLLYVFLLFSGKPAVLFRTGLFSSYIFTLNNFIPSLGHLLILSILALNLSLNFFFRKQASAIIGKGRKYGYSAIVLLIVSGILLIAILHLLFCRLVTDSNISFEAYKVLKLNLYSLAGYTSMILLFLVPFLNFLKALQIFNVLRMHNEKGLSPVLDRSKMLNLSVVFSLFFGLYSLFVISINSEKKTTENMKIQALSFSTENDPEAEHLLLDLWPLIKNDSVLFNMMSAESFQSDYVSITGYLQDTYFNGYWGNYNISIYLCKSDDPLELGGTGEIVGNCFDFFNERIRKYGHRLTGTDFYFIDNQAGRSYYLGEIHFGQDHLLIHGLFIELYSDINIFQPGYSELLLDKKFRGYSGLRDYSFAKYLNGEIVLKSGDFPYNKADDEYIDKDADYRIFDQEKFRHILYKNGNATVIISRPVLNAGNVLITFAYLLAFTFIFINLLLAVLNRQGIRKIISFNFRQKLQFSFIGILLFSFILIGIVVGSLTVREYRSKHYENITEKLNSIYLELDSKLAGEKYLSSDWRNTAYSSLNDLLIKFSNIFNTDINLYDLNGYLIATSREEIFSRDLTGLRMNNTAMNVLKHQARSLYTQTETVGRLKFISAYIPFYNIDGNVLAYVNLPYFRMQSLLAREISNLIVAVTNFTLLLVLITMGLAVFISGRLTSPLTMLSEGLASVELGKKSEHLNYRGSDEIGELVKQYNRMVDELDDSARKLADSEREYAWREMAKQIAHEIKNPLTPMKLNVQQLLKSWKDHIPDFDEKIESFSRNQIEYIDNLSSIASAFSSFAKMPGTNPTEVDLLEQIKTTLELFKSTDNVSFRVRWPRESKIIIFADREQLNGIFSNLFKNSIQAIPSGRKGLVDVSTEVVRNKVIISVRDNGTGIPEDLQRKMFTPNFTTKSSGTGLGLSIVKKYVEGAGGRVWFESEPGTGTSFHIEFPLMFTVERPGGSPHD